jgi:predicted unusual protein kinase regulating ubiquinone biosynthesis (AarF/ABC1/UbiB family)
MIYFRKFQDEAKAVPFDKMRPYLEAELGGPLDSAFLDFEEKPVASASVAQVHKARLKTGEQVAVKIQKPHIRAQFWTDMFMHWVICSVLQFSFDLPLLQFQESIETNLKRELDFRVEAENSKEGARRFQSTGRLGVHIPRVYD